MLCNGNCTNWLGYKKKEKKKGILNVKWQNSIAVIAIPVIKLETNLICEF